MQVSAGFFGQSDVALNDGGLGVGGAAAQTEAESVGTGMDGGVHGHARVFGVLHHGKFQFGGGRESVAHDLIAEDRFAVIGYGDGSGAPEPYEVCQLFSLACLSRGGDGEDVHTGLAFRVLHPAGDVGGVVNGAATGVAAAISETDRGGGPAAAGSWFLLLVRSPTP